MLSFFKKDVGNKIDIVAEYIKVWKEYDYNLNYKTENYKKTNKLAKALLQIENSIEEKENFLEIYKDILNTNRKTLWWIALNISIYEADLWKKMYTIWYESDAEKNFVWKYTLDHWDENMTEWKKDKQEKIEKYSKWKEENSEEYKRIVGEITKLIFSSTKISDEVISKSIDNFKNRPKYNGFSLSDLQEISDDEIEYAIVEYIDEYIIQEDYQNAYSKVTKLSKGMQYVYATWWLEGEVNNGGFNQYFYNSSGQFAEEAYYWYITFGAWKMAEVVKEAIEILFDEIDLYKRTREVGTLEAFSDSYKETKLGKCDEMYYTLEKDALELKKRYIRENLTEFVTK